MGHVMLRNRICTHAILGLIVLALLGAKHTHQIVGKVVGVADGDTITVFDESKMQHKIRLDGIDAPESHQAFGTKAKQALSGKVFDKNVTVKWAEKDKYGRVLGDVYVGDHFINQELVDDGWAWHFKKYSTSAELADSEVRARKASLGLWADKSPVAPWDFRHPTVPANSSPPAEAQSPPKVTIEKAAPEEVTVYVTKSGSKYHLATCKHLSKSKISKTLEDAKKRFSACSVCKPPT